MRQIWITHVHILCSKTLKRQEIWGKETSKEKGLETEMYVLTLSYKLFKCLLPKPKTLCTLLLLLLSPNWPPYKSTLILFLKQTNNPKPCKKKCCKIKIKINKYLKNYAHQKCHTRVKLVKASQVLSWVANQRFQMNVICCQSVECGRELVLSTYAISSPSST
jgi:hypothetical protein